MPPRVELSPGAAVGLAVLICLDPAELCLPFLIAAALHECGHLLALRLCRVPLRRLRIGMTGAVMETAVRSRREELLCAAAGPVVNLLLGALFWRVCPVFSMLNLLLAAWNLLPVSPLDGGRIVAAAAPRFAGAIEVIAIASLVLLAAAATAVFHLGLWPVLLALVLLGKLAHDRAAIYKS